MDPTSNIATPVLNTQHNDASSSVDNVSSNTSSSLNPSNTLPENSQPQVHRTVANFNHVQSRYHAENTEASSYHIFRPADQTMSSPLRVSSHFTKRNLNPQVHSRYHPYLQVNYNKVQNKSVSQHIPPGNDPPPYSSRQYDTQYYHPQDNPNLHSDYYLLDQHNSKVYTSQNPNQNLLYNNVSYGPYPNNYTRPVGQHDNNNYHNGNLQNYSSYNYPKDQSYHRYPTRSTTNFFREKPQMIQNRTHPVSSTIKVVIEKPQASQKKSKPKKTKCCGHSCSAKSSKKPRSGKDYSHITFPKLSTSTEGTRPNQLSLVDKKTIISLLEQKVSIKYLSDHYNIPRTSIYGFQKNKEKINEFLTREYSDPERKRLRRPEFEFVDLKMGEWLKQMRELGVPISGPMCMSKALYFHSLTGSEEPFAASEGWLRNFRTRYGITFQDTRTKPQPVEASASPKNQ